VLLVAELSRHLRDDAVATNGKVAVTICAAPKKMILAKRFR
jgi:hypothetical protein